MYIFEPIYLEEYQTLKSTELALKTQKMVEGSLPKVLRYPYEPNKMVHVLKR